MLTRRSLLLASGTLTLGSLLTGCNSTSANSLHIQLLNGSIPPQLPGEFRRGQPGVNVEFVLRSQLPELFTQLQEWTVTTPSASSLPHFLPGANRQPSSVADLMTLGDAWLAAAIQQKLIQPLKVTELPGWAQLDARWQDLVRRNERGESAADGEIWAAPYRFGTVAIAYRKDLLQPLGWTPTDWKDLWRPELQGKISLPDSPRTVIGIALKQLGESANATDLGAIAPLSNTLKTLHAQTKFYSSDAYLQPLSLDDTWLAVGWSTDIQSMLERDTRIGAVVPAAGSLLFADLWVRPVRARQESPLANQWIDFCWKTDAATRLSLLSNAASPILTSSQFLQNGAAGRSALPPALQTNALLLPDVAVLENSEFLLPLDEGAIAQYQNLWETVRRTSV